MVSGWFAKAEEDDNGFVKAMLADNVKEMNAYMNRIALQTFSYLISEKVRQGRNGTFFIMGLC